MWGKWRPSAEAKRLGDKAVTLERLLTRDHYSFAEAVELLTTPASSPYTVAELEAIYLRLPARSPRPMWVSDDIVPDQVSVEPEAEERVEWSDRERDARTASRVIDGLIETMDGEDRLILQMRFRNALKVPDIARHLHVEQKKVYKRLDKLFGQLRKGLERAGIGREQIGTLLARGDQEIRFHLLEPAAAGEIRPFRPSHSPGADEVPRGEGGLR
jgi:DNA-directed RNA polymerase specialized sigma24 family protein